MTLVRHEKLNKQTDQFNDAMIKGQFLEDFVEATVIFRALMSEWESETSRPLLKKLKGKMPYLSSMKSTRFYSIAIVPTGPGK